MRVGIVGATGLVGRTLIKVLEEENLDIEELNLFASDRSANNVISFHNKELSVEPLSSESISKKFDFLFLCTSSSISETYAKEAANFSPIIIDNSSAFRRVDSIPLVIPEINGHIIKNYKGIIANPNCSTIQMLKAIYPIYVRYGIKEIVVSTYQGVSGAGLDGILALKNKLNTGDVDAVFPKEINENVIPLIGEIDKNGFTEEENKLIFESSKILSDPTIKIYPTAVRVPVVIGHSESVFLRTKCNLLSNEIEELYSNYKGIIYSDELITPKDCEGKNDTFISRLRIVNGNEVLMWVVADNLRVGAAYNAFNILKYILYGG